MTQVSNGQAAQQTAQIQLDNRGAVSSAAQAVQGSDEPGVLGSIAYTAVSAAASVVIGVPLAAVGVIAGTLDAVLSPFSSGLEGNRTSKEAMLDRLDEHHAAINAKVAAAPTELRSAYYSLLHSVSDAKAEAREADKKAEEAKAAYKAKKLGNRDKREAVKAAAEANARVATIEEGIRTIEAAVDAKAEADAEVSRGRLEAGLAVVGLLAVGSAAAQRVSAQGGRAAAGLGAGLGTAVQAEIQSVLTGRAVVNALAAVAAMNMASIPGASAMPTPSLTPSPSAAVPAPTFTAGTIGYANVQEWNANSTVAVDAAAAALSQINSAALTIATSHGNRNATAVVSGFSSDAAVMSSRSDSIGNALQADGKDINFNAHQCVQQGTLGCARIAQDLTQAQLHLTDLRMSLSRVMSSSTMLQSAHSAAAAPGLSIYSAIDVASARFLDLSAIILDISGLLDSYLASPSDLGIRAQLQQSFNTFNGLMTGLGVDANAVLASSSTDSNTVVAQIQVFNVNLDSLRLVVNQMSSELATVINFCNAQGSNAAGGLCGTVNTVSGAMSDMGALISRLLSDTAAFESALSTTLFAGTMTNTSYADIRNAFAALSDNLKSGDLQSSSLTLMDLMAAFGIRAESSASSSSDEGGVIGGATFGALLAIALTVFLVIDSRKDWAMSKAVGKGFGTVGSKIGDALSGNTRAAAVPPPVT